VEKFIDAQKQVLDLAVEKLEPKVRERAKAAPHTSLAQLTQKSVQNFTTAQKSLLDLAIKPIQESKTAAEATPRKAARRPRRKQ
jgi:hypothetical protein